MASTDPTRHGHHSLEDVQGQCLDREGGGWEFRQGRRECRHGCESEDVSCRVTEVNEIAESHQGQPS